MVKLKGPAMSTAASGTLGDLLTFGKLRTTHTLRKRPKPTDPKTGAQISMRAIMQFLTGQWASLGAPNQATWADAPEKGSGSNYNAYLSHNLKRWRNLQAPTKTYPPTENLTPLDTMSSTAHPGVRHCKLSLVSDPPHTPTWGVTVQHSTTGFLLLEDNNVIAIADISTATPSIFTHENVTPGVHYYTLFTFSIDGKWLPPPPNGFAETIT